MKIDKMTYSRNVHTLGSHEIIFREGEHGKHMFVILDGQVEIRKKTGEKSTKTMVILKKGDVFGEMAVVEDKERSATAIALDECRLLRLDIEAFYNLVQQNSDFAVKMIKTLSSRLRGANELIEDVMGSDIEKQLFMGVGEFVKSQGKVLTGESVSFSGAAFCRWAARHLGIPEDRAFTALKRLIGKRLFSSKNDATGGDITVVVSKRILLRIA